jgi:SAM-dependent methyltransferase
MKKLLVDESHTDYLAGQFSYLALRSLDYDAFDGFLKRGIRAQDSPHLVEAFREATRWDHTLFLEVLLPRSPSVRSIFLKKSKILDVGSGTGGWIFRMGESFPLPHYTGIESDAVAIEMATKRARQGGPSSVRFMKGNVEKMTIPREFDLVYLGEVLCVTHRRPQIVRRCFEALKPNGYLVVGEGLLDERSSGEPIGGLMRGMQLDFALLGAGFLSRIQLTDLLRGAGFRGLRFVSAGGGFWFVVARRRRAGCELVASDVLPSKEET